LRTTGQKNIDDKRHRDISFRSSVYKIYERFLKIRGRPQEIALGFSLGIFIGLTPTMGVQIPLAVFFAALLKWSKIAAASGVWITNPFTAPFIYSISYIVGARLLGMEGALSLPGDLSWGTVVDMLRNAPRILTALTVGGVLMGLPLSVLAYYVSFMAVRKYQKDVKEKLARQKARLTMKKNSMKEQMRKRRHP
jgi:uncharacterized protein (DUF2062 family)